MVLPAHGTAGVARQPSQWQTAQLGEATLDSRVAPRFVDQPERLVKEDRDLRTQAQDEVVGDTRFGLRQSAPTGILLIARPSRRAPTIREVAVEIDAAGVLARASGGSVGVEVVQHPQIDASREGDGVQATCHRDSRTLISVNATHDENSAAGEGFPQLLDADRSMLDGMTEQHHPMYPTRYGGVSLWCRHTIRTATGRR